MRLRKRPNDTTGVRILRGIHPGGMVAASIGYDTFGIEFKKQLKIRGYLPLSGIDPRLMAVMPSASTLRLRNSLTRFSVLLGKFVAEMSLSLSRSVAEPERSGTGT